MMSMWDAPSDRDYYAQFGPEPEEDEEEADQACEDAACPELPALEPVTRKTAEFDWGFALEAKGDWNHWPRIDGEDVA